MVSREYKAILRGIIDQKILIGSYYMTHYYIIWLIYVDYLIRKVT